MIRSKLRNKFLQYKTETNKKHIVNRDIYAKLKNSIIQTLVLTAAHKYQRHPSILTIKEKYKNMNFYFSSVSLSSLQNELKSRCMKLTYLLKS